MKRFLWVVLWCFAIGMILTTVNISIAQGNGNGTPWVKQEQNSDSAPSTQGDIGINAQWWCLTWLWSNCFSYDKFVFWKGEKVTKTNEKKSLVTVAQDVIFAATYILWSVLTAVIIYCWLWYIISARGEKDTWPYKRWLINAAIWSILVWTAYAIVRLIQYIAKW